MKDFHDFFISQELQEEAEELGWNPKSINASVKILEADDWGELKRKIGDNREEHDILAFRGGNQELNKKAFSSPKMDVVLHPGKGRKDSGMDHVDAENASKNNVAVGFSLKEIPDNLKTQSQKLNEWRRNLKLCAKHDSPYLITTEGEKFSDLRKPRDLASIIQSLDYNGLKSVKQFPTEILEDNLRVQSDSQIRPGQEVFE